MGRTNNDDSLVTTVENHALYTRTTSRSTMDITTTSNSHHHQQPSAFPSSPAALYTSSTVKSTLSRSCSWAHHRSHHFHFPNDDRQQQPPQLQRDDYHLMVSWPPVSYTCSFCRREFRSAQALGGHMNVHRRDRARLRSSSSSTSSSHDYSSPNSTTITILSSKSAANYNPSLNLNLDPNSPNPNPSHPSLITRTHPSPSIDASIAPAASSPSNHSTFNPNVGGLISTSAINTVRNSNPVLYSIGSDTTPSMEMIRVERRRGGGPFDPKNFLAVRSSILSSGGGGGNNPTKNMIRGDTNRAYRVIDSYKRSVGGDEAGHLNHGLLEDIWLQKKKKNGMLSEYLNVTQIGLGRNVAAFGDDDDDDDDDEVEFMSVEGGDDLADDQVDLELRLGYNY